jgi:hypothetical protein
MFYGMVIRTGKIYQYSHDVYIVALKTMECKVSGLLGFGGVGFMSSIVPKESSVFILKGYRVKLT